MSPKKPLPSVPFADWRHDLPAALIVFLVALPLSMGTAVAAGFPASAGLIAAVVGGVVVGLLGGAPLQVSGPSVALTVLVYQAWQQFGVESLGVLVIACGVLQILFALFRLGVWYRAVSPAVWQGLMAGIGALIFVSQFHVMVDDRPQSSGLANLVTIPEAVQKGFPPPALESAEERAAVRDAMERLSGLHQRQTELLEEVHHLLAGTMIGKVDADASEGEQDEALIEEMLLSASLQELAPRQMGIVEELAGLRGDGSAPALAAALEGSRRALNDLETGDVAAARGSQDSAERLLLEARDTTKHHRWAATVGILTISILIGWQSVVTRRVPYLPGVIAAVAIMTAAASFWQLPLSFAELPERMFSESFFPNWGELTQLTEPGVLLLALEFALVGCAESLLCAARLDRRFSGPRADYNRELLGQGIGNVCCGFLRALPVAGSLVASSANARSGARSRLSAVVQGLLVAAFVAVAAQWLHRVPIAVLAAVMVYSGYRLIDHRGARRLWRENRIEFVIFALTAVAVFAIGVLPGILVGIVFSIGRLVWEFSRLEIEKTPEPDNGRYVLTLRGNATFLRLPFLADALADVPRDAELHLNVEGLDVIDRACLDLLHDWQRENEPYGGRLALNQDSLAARFWRRPRRRQEENGQATKKRERQVPI